MAEYKLTSDSGKLITSSGVYETAIKWAISQGPQTVMLFAISYWGFVYAPGIIENAFENIVAKVHATNQADKDKAETRHEKQIEKLTTYMDAERKAFDGNIKDITKACGEQTKAISDLVMELRRDRNAKGTAGSGN